jgi:dolichyl-phosphate-mannose-protein mannosyltransferase
MLFAKRTADLLVNQVPYKPQDEVRSDRPREGCCERWFQLHFVLGAILVSIAGFLVRLKTAWGTFLNPDEALHYLLANQSSWREAYRASLTNAHPPLLTFVLHVWRALGDSEVVLRLPSVIAGTAFCWIFFKWLTQLFGQGTGFIGLLLMSFLPPMIELSTEVRQYALLLLFLSGAALWLERSLAESSEGKMVVSAMLLCLALLTHYSAILFAAAIGIYSLLRIVAHRPARKVLLAWALGQVAVMAVFAFLYGTHISKLKGDYASGTINGWLANSFFHPGHDNPISFVVARTGGVFQYAFGQLAVGDVAFLAFIASVVLLGGASPNKNFNVRYLRALLVLPFAVAAAASLARMYPYGGTRHSAFLLMFAVAGVSYFLAWLVKQRMVKSAVVAVFVIAVCTAFGKPHRPYMLREDQDRGQMTRAMQFIHFEIPQPDLIVVDYQTRLLLAHYLCPERSMPFTASGARLEQFPCGGHRFLAASPELYTFTAENFELCWGELLRSHWLRTGQAVWVIQAGWEGNLSHDLATGFPEFYKLKSRSFGRNITIFKMPGTGT